MDITLTKLLEDFWRAKGNDLHVCLPGKIIKYDSNTHLATVQPLLRRQGDASEYDYSPISKVPVIHPRTAGAIIKLPVTKNDIVTLVFADKSLDEWISGDGSSKGTLDQRQHDTNDAYAILGGYPEKKTRKTNNPSALEILVTSGTKIVIGNDSVDLLSLSYTVFSQLSSLCGELSTTMSDIQSITHIDPQGGTTGTPLNATNFATIQASVNNIKTQIDSAISSLGAIKV